MKKYILAVAMLTFAAGSYSQMFYDFKQGQLVDAQSSKKRAKIETKVSAGEVYLKSGEVLQGNFAIPERTTFGTPPLKITCFPSKERRSIKGEDIDMLKVFSTSETKAHTFIFSKFNQVKMLGKTQKKLRATSFDDHKIVKHKVGRWMMLLVKGKADLYVTGHGFMFLQDGSMAPFVTGDQMSTPPIVYLGQMEGRDERPIAIHLAGRGGNIAYFRSFAPAFFEGHPIAEKIRNEEEGYHKDIDIVHIFETYNKDNE